MNERIKQLAEQAGMTDDKFGMFFAKDKHNEDGVDLEKFAELIVKECCNVLIQEGNKWHEFAKNPPEGQGNVTSAALFAAFRLKEDAVDAVQEHFGVEHE
jgi:hypothetical protein